MMRPTATANELELPTPNLFVYGKHRLIQLAKFKFKIPVRCVGLIFGVRGGYATPHDHIFGNSSGASHSFADLIGNV
jgi:hypothetical protein